MKLWMITASATDDGAAIYLQASGRWTAKLGAAMPLANEAERDALLEAARADERNACDPYAIRIERSELGLLAAISLKEKIRAAGPTIPLVESQHKPSVLRPALVGA